MAETDRAAQRRAELFDRYSDRGMQQGHDLQGEYFLRTVDLLDELDAEWTDAWLTFVYDYMYGRGVLDDKTRTLIVIGECIAAGHFEQLPNHMRTAMTVGADPKEVLEVCLQSAIYCGMPSMRRAVTAFRTTMQQLGVMTLKESPFRYSEDR
jgi:alkylhydroperoxidase/carboxymuconolactone decarboxylase family protein YurZ